ncbi:MAG: Uma2 family endonuclease [Acidobacteria bacterium]|nr:Uma2 family endonuclease [Acidobacteriota bacterium]
MTVHTKPSLSPAEYLAMERAAERKSEYLDGEVIGMTGASRRHSLITLNVGAELNRQLEDRPCEVYVNDLRVLVVASRLYTYPDVVVVCGEPALTDRYKDTLTNPTVLIEVLSPSTEAYDRGTKFAHYRSLDSLREYLLIGQDRPRVEQYIRQENGSWLFFEEADLAAFVVLPSIECRIPLDRIYKKVRFGEIES